MDRTDVAWRGYFSALPTPFTEAGELDLPAFRAIVELFVSQGVHGLLVNGSTGEWPLQTLDERKRLASEAVAAAAGRVPVIVGVMHPRTAQAVELAQHAEQIGADAVMAAPPAGVRPTPRELHQYYVDVFGATNLPAWLYNFPQDAAADIAIEQLDELVAIPNVVAIKQSTPDDRTFYATVEAVSDRVLVFGHLLSRLGLSAIAGGFGGDGHFGSGMLLGERMPRFFELAWQGRLDEAAEIADINARLMSRLRGPDTDGYNWRYGGMQASLKAAMNLLGQPGGLPRQPKLPITDPESLDAIRAALKEARLAV